MDKDIMIIKWDYEKQKYIVGRIGVFTDHKGNNFLDEEFFFPTDKTIEEILDFLRP